MNATSRQKKAPTDDWTATRVVFELHSAGWSLRQLAIKHTYKSSALGAALHRRYPKAESLIANALGIKPDEIWPSRYENSKPIGRRVMNGFGVAA